MAQKILGKNRSRFGIAFLWIISICCLYTTTAHARDAEKMVKQKAFEQVFGDAVRLDPAMVAKVKDDTPGKRHYVDKDNDGKPEEVWFIDIEPRHTEAKKPILVKVIDENGTLEMGKEPETYGDLWIADWHADGLVDAATWMETGISTSWNGSLIKRKTGVFLSTDYGCLFQPTMETTTCSFTI